MVPRVAQRFQVYGRKRRFLNNMMSYIIQRMPCKGFSCISIVLAFQCGQAKTIRISYVWTRMFLENREKNIRFQKLPDKCGQGLSLVAKKHGQTAKTSIEYNSWVKSITFFRNQTPYPRISPPITVPWHKCKKKIHNVSRETDIITFFNLKIKLSKSN